MGLYSVGRTYLDTWEKCHIWKVSSGNSSINPNSARTLCLRWGGWKVYIRTQGKSCYQLRIPMVMYTNSMCGLEQVRCIDWSHCILWTIRSITNMWITSMQIHWTIILQTCDGLLLKQKIMRIQSADSDHQPANNCKSESSSWTRTVNTFDSGISRLILHKSLDFSRRISLLCADLVVSNTVIWSKLRCNLLNASFAESNGVNYNHCVLHVRIMHNLLRMEGEAEK